MKRNLLIFIFCTLLLLSSCAWGTGKQSVCVNRPSGNVCVEYNDCRYTAQIQYSDTGVMSVKLLSPLKNVSITVGYNGCEIAYDDMTIEYTAEQAESFCPFLGLYSLLKTVCYTEPESVRHDGEDYAMRFNDGVNSCRAVTDSDGTLKEIEADGMKFIFT